jgi:hypothetical protein
MVVLEQMHHCKCLAQSVPVRERRGNALTGTYKSTYPIAHPELAAPPRGCVQCQIICKVLLRQIAILNYVNLF